MSLFLFLSLALWSSCTDTPLAPARAGEPAPRELCQMPKELLEISGLTDVDATTVACIQDETGVLYFYDVERCEVTRTITFEDTGDFEGVTRVDDTYYVLRSDGRLFEITDLQAEQPKVRDLATNVPAGDNEGLAYDAQTRQLLIAPKADYTNENYEDEFRAVYAFDPRSGKRAEQPFLQLTLATLTDFLSQQQGLKLDRKKKSDELKLKFELTGLATHPSQDRVYLLLGPDQLLLTVNRKGEPLSAQYLDKDQFPQPEGITFLGDNTLVISSEGKKDGAGTLALFDAP